MNLTEIDQTILKSENIQCDSYAKLLNRRIAIAAQEMIVNDTYFTQFYKAALKLVSGMKTRVS